MPRLPRSSFPASGVWHVTTRGVERRRVFVTRDDALSFMTLLGRAVDERELRGLVLCLMPTHYHFVVEGLREHLSQALHRVNGIYAETFNTRYRRSGHLRGDRFALWQVRDDDHLVATCRYVLANPVRAGLCERPEDWGWRWSGYELERATNAPAARRA